MSSGLPVLWSAQVSYAGPMSRKIKWTLTAAVLALTAVLAGVIVADPAPNPSPCTEFTCSGG